MMYSFAVFAVFFSLSLTIVIASPATADSTASASRATGCQPHYCSGTNGTDANYVCGDARLGPKKLPKKMPLGDLVDDYDRFGGLCPGAFLTKWFNGTSGFYNYPPQNGFQLNTDSAPIDGNQTLFVGMKIDRFGSEFGRFTSPVGAPYSQRALPPSNLDTSQTAPVYPYNYHIYRVEKPFVVLSGPIAPWFSQPGQGVQYQMYDSVMNLIAGGFLSRVNMPA